MENMKKRAPRVVSGNTASSLYVQNADGHPLSSSISNVPQAEKQNKPEGNASSSQSTHPAMDMTEWEFQCLTRSLSSDILLLSKPLFFLRSMGNCTPAVRKKAMALLFSHLICYKLISHQYIAIYWHRFLFVPTKFQSTHPVRDVTAKSLVCLWYIWKDIRILYWSHKNQFIDPLPDFPKAYISRDFTLIRWCEAPGHCMSAWASHWWMF